MDNSGMSLVIDFGFFLVLIWVIFRLYKCQGRFENIEKQIQLLFKRIDDFLKRKHV